DLGGRLELLSPYPGVPALPRGLRPPRHGDRAYTRFSPPTRDAVSGRTNLGSAYLTRHCVPNVSNCTRSSSGVTPTSAVMSPMAIGSGVELLTQRSNPLVRAVHC